MTRALWVTIAAGAVGLLGAATCLGAPADGERLYALTTPPSSLQYGCFGPCECPVMLLPTYGSFQLVLTSVDPLYTNYEVRNYIASFNNGPGAVAITGSGTYRIGGEVAYLQQMTLDLVVEGRPAQHFDSGLVPLSVPFPEIDVSCAVHGFACQDSVVRVDAKPIETAGIAGNGHAVVGITAVKPEPFRDQAVISFTLPRPEPFDLTVVDLAGRRVRSLEHGAYGGTGQETVTWDGRRDDGRRAPAGIYWVRLRCADGSDQRRIIKLN